MVIMDKGPFVYEIEAKPYTKNRVQAYSERNIIQAEVRKCSSSASIESFGCRLLTIEQFVFDPVVFKSLPKLVMILVHDPARFCFFL